MKIIELDKKTIEKIAAGEVIESPVSIVKELVENSIDANAKIKNGGKSYIRVTDDGLGIDEDDFKRAFKRHATSKIKDFSDLYDLFTLGFRGEALSSIVACANIKAISKTKNQKEKIKNCDIFISAIGKANFYNKDYFRNGQIIIDAGVSFVDGNMYGDVDYEYIKDLDIKIVTCKNGVGSITTLSLLESLLYS